MSKVNAETQAAIGCVTCCVIYPVYFGFLAVFVWVAVRIVKATWGH